MLWIEHICMLVRWKQLSGEIARVTHSSFPHLSFAYSSPAPLILTSKKVKIFSSFSLVSIFCLCPSYAQWVHAAWWLIFGNVAARGVMCTCGTVGNQLGLGWINYYYVLCMLCSGEVFKWLCQPFAAFLKRHKHRQINSKWNLNQLQRMLFSFI